MAAPAEWGAKLPPLQGCNLAFQWLLPSLHWRGVREGKVGNWDSHACWNVLWPPSHRVGSAEIIRGSLDFHPYPAVMRIPPLSWWSKVRGGRVESGLWPLPSSLERQKEKTKGPSHNYHSFSESKGLKKSLDSSEEENYGSIQGM